VWAAVLAGVLSLYALGYAGAVLLQGSPWLPRLRPVNLALAWVVIALALLLHTPGGDPLAWSLRDQLERLRSGRVQPEEFDYAYLRFSLGREGYEALEALAAAAPPGSVARTRTQRALEVDSYWNWEQKRRPRRFARVPEDAPWPPGLEEALKASGYVPLGWCTGTGRCLVFDRDLDGDGRDEAVVAMGAGRAVRMAVFAVDPEHVHGWRLLGSLESVGSCCLEPDEQMDLVAEGRVELVPPGERDLLVGDSRFRLIGPK
jgi:hypothetical protein